MKVDKRLNLIFFMSNVIKFSSGEYNFVSLQIIISTKNH